MLGRYDMTNGSDVELSADEESHAMYDFDDQTISAMAGAPPQ